MSRFFFERCIGNAHTSTSDNAIYDFSKKAVENGLDIFRVFDSLNYIGTLILVAAQFMC